MPPSAGLLIAVLLAAVAALAAWRWRVAHRRTWGLGYHEPSPDGKLMAHATLLGRQSRWRRPRSWVDLEISETSTGRTLFKQQVDLPERLAQVELDALAIAWSEDSSGVRFLARGVELVHVGLGELPAG
jgi:hypothetical protein